MLLLSLLRKWEAHRSNGDLDEVISLIQSNALQEAVYLTLIREMTCLPLSMCEISFHEWVSPIVRSSLLLVRTVLVDAILTEAVIGVLGPVLKLPSQMTTLSA